MGAEPQYRRKFRRISRGEPQSEHVKPDKPKKGNKQVAIQPQKLASDSEFATESSTVRGTGVTTTPENLKLRSRWARKRKKTHRLRVEAAVRRKSETQPKSEIPPRSRKSFANHSQHAEGDHPTNTRLLVVDGRCERIWPDKFGTQPKGSTCPQFR